MCVTNPVKLLFMKKLQKKVIFKSDKMKDFEDRHLKISIWGLKDTLGMHTFTNQFWQK